MNECDKMNECDFDRAWIDNIWKNPPELYEICFKLLVSKCDIRGKKILDVGCGDGRFLAQIKKHDDNCEITGLDISSVALERAKKTLPQINYIHCDFEAYVSNQKFDIIICLDFLYYFGDVELIIKKIRDMLTTNGVVLYSLHNYNYGRYRANYIKNLLAKHFDIITEFYVLEKNIGVLVNKNDDEEY